MILLGVAGKLESGKDTVADYLVKHKSYVKLSFADNLKEICMHTFGLTYDQCYTTEGKLTNFDKPLELTKEHINKISDWLYEKNDIFISPDMYQSMLHVYGFNVEYVNPRHILQHVGTEIMRDCVHPDIHVSVTLDKIKSEKIQKAIIPDARFENERRLIKESGGHLILVDCVQTREQESTHRSETGIGNAGDYDYCIINDKELGLDIFYGGVNIMCERMNL